MSNRAEYMLQMGRSLGSKLMILFGISVFIVLCLTSLVFIYNQYRELHDRMFRRGMLLADVLSTNLVPSVYAENKKMVGHDIKGILRQRYVLSIKVVSSSGTVLSNEVNKADGDEREILVSFAGNEGRKWQEGPFTIHEVRDAFAIRKPIVIHAPADLEEALFYDEIDRPKTENIIGFVEIIFDNRSLNRETFMLLMKGAPVAIALVIVAGLIMFWIVRKSMRPLANLTCAVDALGREGSAGRVEVETDDEIGRLAISFNEMTENLKKREKEKEALEERLLQSRKMEAVGNFAKGIAHDFNNILATVKASVFIMEKKFSSQTELKEHLDPVKNSLSRAKNLIEGLLTFSRRRKPDLQQMRLSILIRRMVPAIKETTGESVEVRVETTENGPSIMADSVQMEQVLMNLAGNARDAMPDGGTLTIKTGVVQRPDRDNLPVSAATVDSGQFPSAAGTGYAEISVRDTGIGMDSSTKEKIFEPFFTTKETGRGTGLGLAIVYGIIEQHKGFIEVDSVEGEGTEFRIYLPVIPEQSSGQ